MELKLGGVLSAVLFSCILITCDCTEKLTQAKYIARSANLPTGLYILLVLISFLFIMIARSPIMSGSSGPIFAIISPNDRYLFVSD